jgi:adenine-specific DNA-methyltransferase
VARDLLSEDGVIFVQCDDNEQAYLKVLMDEIFGRGNFLNDIIWIRESFAVLF